MLGVIKDIHIEAIAATVSQNCVSIQEHTKGLITEKKAKRLAKSIGIEKLSIADLSLCTSDLCFVAAEKIFSETTTTREEIGAILFVSQTADYILPATSHILQNRLGLSHDIIAIDVNLGCSGYVYGIYIAAFMLNSLNGRKVLLCVGDTASRSAYKNDLATRPIFGDAGTASIIAIEKGKSLYFNIETFGERYKAILMERGGSRACRVEENENVTEHLIRENYTQMDGVGVMEFTLKDVPHNIEMLIKYCNIDKRQIDLFAFHQANKLIVDSLGDCLSVDLGKVPFAAKETGNTSSASIPLVFTEQFAGNGNDQLKTVLLSGFGVGLSIATAIVDMSNTKILETIQI